MSGTEMSGASDETGADESITGGRAAGNGPGGECRQRGRYDSAGQGRTTLSQGLTGMVPG